jgi:branched-chain amino acid transport system ATP-binding protein
VQFGGVLAVNDVSMHIDRGRIHGLIGPNGAGKSTLFNAMSGLVPIRQGSICFERVDVTHLPVHLRAPRGIRRTFQHVQLMEDRTVLENVLVGMHTAISTNPFKSVLGLGTKGSPDKEAREAAREALDFLGIGHIALTEMGGLTIAEHRFAELARALVAKPRLLLLDEPAAGLSLRSTEALDALLIRIRDEWGATIVLVEHRIDLVLNVSDVVTVLDNGSIIASGRGQDVIEDPAVKRAYLGVDEEE